MEVSEQVPSKADYMQLHGTTGWNAKGLYNYEQLYMGICNSWASVSIYEDKQLTGFGRIVSDGIYQTFICDVMVHPSYQKLGVGTEVMNQLLEKCKKAGIQWVQLFCASGKQEFYKKLGFIERESEAPGMSLFF